MSTNDETTTDERKLVGDMLADVRQIVSRNSPSEDLLAYVQALSLASIANALEDLNRYGVEISLRDGITASIPDTVGVSIRDSITVHTR